MDTGQGVTLGIALVGAILGVLNTYIAVDRDRVKLRVVPKLAIGTGGMDPRPRPCIEVVNRSGFPVTVSQVGFRIDRSDDRMIAFDYLLQGGDRLPVRLESRSGFSMYWPPEALQDPRFQNVTKAFAETDCGVTVTGTSGALRSMKDLAGSAGS